MFFIIFYCNYFYFFSLSFVIHFSYWEALYVEGNENQGISILPKNDMKNMLKGT